MSVVAVWASISLRSNTDQRLRSRVDIAYAGLEERARETFQKLRDDIDRLYPTSTAPFDPATAFQDPGALGQSAKKGVAILRMRSVIEARFHRMLAVCSWIRNGAFTFTALVVAATALYFLSFDLKVLWGIVAGAAVLVFLACVVGVLTFAWLESSIQKAVETSSAGVAP
ncbi:hypothetical protein [Frondihabitans australicus]|uniref:hypothetical protein n=1 Tax=Frondihabitans australicus TaxID=386892 RepID=UPI0011C39007|nr:hypothetical protein [Frondihabitans australicus]